MTSPVWRKGSVRGRKGAGWPCTYLQQSPRKRWALGGEFCLCREVDGCPLEKNPSHYFPQTRCALETCIDSPTLTAQRGHGVFHLCCKKFTPYITHELGGRKCSNSCPPTTEQDRACWLSFPGRQDSTQLPRVSTRSSLAAGTPSHCG